MDYEELRLEKAEGIGVLTLNRPEKLNALTVKMTHVILPKLLRELQRDDEVRVLVITGAGRGFCVGADIGELKSFSQINSELTRAERLQTIGAFAPLLYNLGKPVIAAVNGVAAGAGVSIALLADMRIAAESARFGLTFVARGLVPDCGATLLLPRLIGTARSFELMYTGEFIDAKGAERIGLVNKVVPQDSLMGEAIALAKRLAKGPPLALSQIRCAVHQGIVNNLEQQLYVESYAQNFCFGTEDFQEGLSSFLEKREPQFKGR